MIEFDSFRLYTDDDNRIPLNALPDAKDCQRDYINACYVDVREFETVSIPTSCERFFTCSFKNSRDTPFQRSSLPLKVSHGHTSKQLEASGVW